MQDSFGTRSFRFVYQNLKDVFSSILYSVHDLEQPNKILKKIDLLYLTHDYEQKKRKRMKDDGVDEDGKKGEKRGKEKRRWNRRRG